MGYLDKTPAGYFIWSCSMASERSIEVLLRSWLRRRILLATSCSMPSSSASKLLYSLSIVVPSRRFFYPYSLSLIMPSPLVIILLRLTPLLLREPPDWLLSRFSSLLNSCSAS